MIDLPNRGVKVEKCQLFKRSSRGLKNHFKKIQNKRKCENEVLFLKELEHCKIHI